MNGDDAELLRWISRQVQAPLSPTPCDFGLDRLLLEMHNENRQVRRRCRRLRVLRWIAVVRRRVWGGSELAFVAAA